MSEKVQIIKSKSSKRKNLFLGLLFDFIGMLSYLIPGVTEYTDIIWAPISAFLMFSMYKGLTGKVAGVVSFIEEAFPFIDIIPTFTLTWIYKYVINKED
jgi:hypothetical protein